MAKTLATLLSKFSQVISAATEQTNDPQIPDTFNSLHSMLLCFQLSEISHRYDVSVLCSQKNLLRLCCKLDARNLALN